MLNDALSNTFNADPFDADPLLIDRVLNSTTTYLNRSDDGGCIPILVGDDYLCGAEAIQSDSQRTVIADEAIVAVILNPIIDDFIDNFDDQIIWGTEEDDIIYGYHGNDYILGLGDNDILFGDKGEDTLEGGEGRDILFGGKDNDSLLGGNDRDTLEGDDGDDTLSGGNDMDTLRGDRGNDVLLGGAGNDDLTGGGKTVEFDSLTGGAGADTFILADYTESLYLGLGHATITDFTPLAGDKIDVYGAANNYDIVNMNNGDAHIRLNGDWIAIVQGGAGVLNATHLI